MIDPRLVLILLVLMGGYYVGEQAVAGIKAVDRKIVHVTKATGHKIGHVLKKAVGK
jgi:xanthosine utilization system XapX-like protein